MGFLSRSVRQGRMWLIPRETLHEVMVMCNSNPELVQIKKDNVGHDPLWPEEQYAKPRTQGKSTRQEEAEEEEEANQEVIPRTNNRQSTPNPQGSPRIPANPSKSASGNTERPEQVSAVEEG